VERAAAERTGTGSGGTVAPPPRSRLERLGAWTALAALLIAPLVMLPGVREPFRLPKQLLTELLVPLSLLLLAFGLRRAERVDWREILALPAVRALGPLWLVALASRLLTAHPAHASEGLWSLSIGMLAIAGWSVALPGKRRALDLLLVPAGLLALLAVLQHHELFRPFVLARTDERLQMSSLTGNVADLGAYLVLPLLVAQAGLARSLGGPSGGGGRRLTAAVVALGILLFLYTLLLGRTLSALAATAASSGVFWLLRAPRRWRIALAVAAGLALIGGLLVVAPARERVLDKVDEVREGRLNDLLTGRLDGWRAGAHMLAVRPLLGVGPGVYSAEFVPAKLALQERGAEFWAGHTAGSQFANAHSEPIELAAELGALGVLALLWAGWTLLGALRRRPVAPASGDPVDADRRALQWSGLAALAVLSLTYFPLRTALVAYPYVLLLAWVLEPRSPAAAEDEPAAVPAAEAAA
jgi:O-antigen ligase